MRWNYENCHNAAKANERVKDLKEICEALEISDNISIDRLKMGKSYLVCCNWHTECPFTSHSDAQAFLRAHCIAMRKARREASVNKDTTEA